MSLSLIRRNIFNQAKQFHQSPVMAEGDTAC
jgi:hypothetical protein